MFKRMDHVGIVVNDIDATIKTYQDQLGFTLLQRTEIPEIGRASCRERV